MRIHIRDLVIASLAVPTLAIGLAVPASAAAPAAHKTVASSMFETNDPDISAHSNGVGAQYSTTLEGNATNVTRVAEGTACGGLTVYSFHNASGVDWMRVPAGADTLNLSTIRDVRAEFIGHPAAHSGMIYNSFITGCSDTAVIENVDLTGQNMFVRDLPNGAFDNYTIR